MSLVNRIFAFRIRPIVAAPQVDQDRARALGTAPLQSAEEQASVRQQMEAELDAQRQRREQARQPS